MRFRSHFMQLMSERWRKHTYVQLDEEKKEIIFIKLCHDEYYMLIMMIVLGLKTSKHLARVWHTFWGVFSLYFWPFSPFTCRCALTSWLWLWLAALVRAYLISLSSMKSSSSLALFSEDDGHRWVIRVFFIELCDNQLHINTIYVHL